ncbi:hypothetical protein HWD35_00145 [Tsukamurella tyrosinosolvens]|uniref:group I intron-associated PD-(D/E)XK endonuclease n=1 Tax=Tsukamurella tyrosinosolvens TaxID=57704 RepID=UPI0007998282|nr:group I intron-associated PD-(D/E)XK endonuclease [Tsukamurella tyrosinosolvens]KXP06227.1 hypothetical protein AXK59_12265 [Tsukamurella tyrosinosolvens]KZL96059.1 hypothetical protein AXX05_23370 [Tsukamurella tyrosinosolvens]MCA4993104.1 hypothetical protein [Tsukamurella tyrosinosolvens]
MGARTYTDEQLIAAVASASSWRAVMRELGLKATSSGAIRSVRERADALGLAYVHFGRQRSWTDDELRQAVAESVSWAEVADKLGSGQRSSVIRMARRDAQTLGLAIRRGAATSAVATGPRGSAAGTLSRAGSMLAAAWFTLHGHDVSWPLEPCRYDLMVHTGVGILKIQVKTTVSRAAGSWKVYLSSSRQGGSAYRADEIDEFFIVDGDLALYRLPIGAVEGMRAIHLSSYAEYRVDGFDRCSIGVGGYRGTADASGVLRPVESPAAPRGCL